MSTLTQNNLKILKLAIDETLWPTRCAICDKPGNLLCQKCARQLPFIDIHKTCQICGEPFGLFQCCNCNPVTKDLSEEERKNFRMNFDQAISVTRLNQDSGRLIALFKDGGEQRLCSVIAYFMSKYIPSK